MAGARPLFDDRARDRDHLLLAAGQVPGRVIPELLQGREEAADPLDPVGVERAIARGQVEVLAHGEFGEHGHAFGDVGDAGARDVGRGQLRDVGAAEADAAAAGAPQAHDGAQRGGLAGAVPAQQHRQAAARHHQVNALQDVVLADMGVDPGQGQEGLN
jgi:hypothetical protein